VLKIIHLQSLFLSLDLGWNNANDEAFLCMCMHVHAYMHGRVCARPAVSVACTLEQVFWALVHGRVCFYTNVHICDTLTTGCAYVCVCISVCICMRVCMDACMRLGYCLTRWGVVTGVFCLFMRVHMHAYVCVCACVRVWVHVYVCICMYVFLCICVHVRLCARACGCTYALV